MTAQLKLADGQTFVEGRSRETARKLLDAAKDAGREGEVLTTSFGYIVPSEILDGEKPDADGGADAAAAEAEAKAKAEADAKAAAEAEADAEAEEENTAKEFDPSEADVEEVLSYIEGADEDERKRVFAAEKSGKARVTILRTEEGAK